MNNQIMSNQTASAQQPAIPQSVAQVLSACQVDFSKVALKNSTKMNIARKFEVVLILLTDGRQQFQFMLPANCLIDLRHLFQQTQRHFKALEARALAQLLGTTVQPFLLPALPQLMGLTTWIDERLLSLEQIFLRLDASQVLEISQPDFRKLIAVANIHSLALSIPELSIPIDHWQEADIAQVNHCVSRFTSMRIKQRLDETLNVPSLPEIANDIIQLRMQPDAQTTQLAAIVARDPSLSAQVISWANSPYYGVKQPVHSVQDAVVRVLGFDLVINLALGLALGRELRIPKQGIQGYSSYWQKALFMAHLAVELGRRLPAAVRPSSGLCYLSGLLHNFGYLIIAHVFPPLFETLCRHIEVNPHVPRACLEKHLIGITREQISSSLFQQWHLPHVLCVAVRYQNHPFYSGEHHVLPKVLHLASSLLQAQGMGDGLISTTEASAYTPLQLSDEDRQAAVAALLTKRDSLLAASEQLNRGI